MAQLSLLTEPAIVPTEIISDNTSSIAQAPLQKPLDFSALVGQSIASYLLGSAIAPQRVAKAYLFAGVDGVGKTLAAKIFSAQLLGTKTISFWGRQPS